jgi:hypothetical protein
LPDLLPLIRLRKNKHVLIRTIAFAETAFNCPVNSLILRFDHLRVM